MTYLFAYEATKSGFYIGYVLWCVTSCVQTRAVSVSKSFGQSMRRQEAIYKCTKKSGWEKRLIDPKIKDYEPRQSCRCRISDAQVSLGPPLVSKSPKVAVEHTNSSETHSVIGHNALPVEGGEGKDVGSECSWISESQKFLGE